MIRNALASKTSSGCAAALVFLLTSGPAAAATLLVTTRADSGAGSLRAAVAAALAGDTVAFAPAINGVTIVLTSSEIVIDRNLIVLGNGVNATRISGANARRVFNISSAAAVVSISGLSLLAGNAGDAGSGGAIRNVGDLSLDAVRLQSNRAGVSGGAVYSVANNTAGVSGRLRVSSSTFDDNRIDASNCGSGAAIRSEGAGSQTVLINSTLSGNIAGSNCSGGAIGFNDGSLIVVSSTLGPNQGGSSGGNVYKGSRVAAMTMRNSVLVEGTAALNPDLHGASAGLMSDGHNLVGNRGDGAGFVASDLPMATAPLLDVLRMSLVGQTPVRIPMAASPLVDAVGAGSCVDAGGVALLAVDQRGVARPQAAACDIGAAERSFVIDELLFRDGFE